MNFKRFHESKNLFDKSTVTLGKVWYQGGKRNSTVGGYSDYIKVTPETNYYIINVLPLSVWYSVCAYTATKQFIAYCNLSSLDATEGVITTPANCEYIIINFYANRIDEVMVNVGSTPLPYEPYGNTWLDSHYIMGTDTDTITTLPAIIYPLAQTATLGLKGQTVQNGTPTSDNPIMPQGTGDKTANLWENSGFSAVAIGNSHNHVQSNSYGTTLSSTIGTETIITQSNYPTGNSNYQNGFFFIDVDFSKYNVGDVITLSFDYICNEIHSVGTLTNVYAGTPTNSLPVVLSSGSWNISGRLTVQITIITNMLPYVEVRLCGNSITVKNVMVNTGSTALPYEPYGIKIPISSNSITTPVYLGEVQSTRRIKQWVLDGTETWSKGNYAPTGGYQFFTPKPADISVNPDWLTTHFKKGSALNGSAFASYLSLYPEASILPENATANDFKAWLAAQYAAGTPVTVWYVLATETTGIVNEPLMKIGDYADSISGISIPTTAGANTLDVLTTLKPSEVTASFNGWHPVSAAHERSGGGWT